MNYRTPNILKSFSGLLPLMMVAAPLFSSCRESSSDKAADNVALAEDALVNRDYRYAVTVCDSLVSAPGFEALGVDRLCRLSMLCVRLADAGAIEGECGFIGRQRFRGLVHCLSAGRGARTYDACQFDFAFAHVTF